MPVRFRFPLSSAYRNISAARNKNFLETRELRLAAARFIEESQHAGVSRFTALWRRLLCKGGWERVLMTAATPQAKHSDVHPLHQPSQRTLRRRLNNYSIYRTIRRAIRDCGVKGPVLMAPCGYGWFFDRFGKDNIEVVGIDIDAETVHFARTAVQPPPTIHQASILELPFKDGEFEFIVNNRFMPHFDEDFRGKAFKELARVTSRYVLVHYDTMSLRQVLRTARGAKKPEREIEKIAGWRKTQRKDRKLLFSRERMAAEGAAAGLKLKKLYYVCYLISDRVYTLYEKA
jgi:2-polyprenyl-3-methyl-5-hydroxy-6-metoxy-1,4-benzoquinol methylase